MKINLKKSNEIATIIALFLWVNSTPLVAQEVEVIGDLKITNGSQGEGKVLGSDSVGVAKWVSKNELLIEMHKNLDGGLIRLIQWGVSPVDIWASGVPYDSIIGIDLYDGINGGEDEYIFYIDTADIYPFSYMITGKPNYTYAAWACDGIAISGADSPLFGDGAQNTLDVNTACPPLTNPTSVFRQVFQNLGQEWHIASVDEATLIYTELIVSGIYDPTNGNGNKYWTSSEAQGVNEATHAIVIDKTNGVTSEEVKSFATRGFIVKAVPD